MQKLTPLILFFYLAFLSFVFGIHPVGDYDIWWHIASGNWMYEHGQIPKTDPFSWTNLGAPWIYHEWGFGLLASALWNMGGIKGIVLLKVLLLFLILYFSCRSIQILKQNNQIPYLSLIILAFLIFPRVQPRPHMFSNLFYVFLFYTFHCYAAGFWHDRKRLYIIPFLFMIWTNIHWGALVGWGLMALFWLSQVWFSLQKGDKNCHGVLFKVCLLSGAALVVNPNTYHVFTFPFEHLNMTHILQGTREWFSPFGRNYARYYVYQVYFVFFFLSLGLALIKWRKNHPDRTLLLLPLVYLSARYNRYIDMFFLFFVPLLAVEWKELSFWRHDRWERIRKYGQSTALLASVAVLTILLYTGIPLGYGLKGNYAMEWGTIHSFTDFFPPVDFLEKNNVEEPIFNYFAYGGFLMLKGFPVYIDGRTPVYGDEFFKIDYMDAFTSSDRFEEIWKKWNFGVVFIAAGARLSLYLAHHDLWRMVYADDHCFIFLDTTKESNKPIIEKYGSPQEEEDPFLMLEGEMCFDNS